MASTFDIEKELEDVNKRLREQTAKQLLTPGGRSPDLKRLKSQILVGEGDEAAAEKTRSGALENALGGLPEQQLPKLVDASTPQTGASMHTPLMLPPSKPPSPMKPPVIPSPRNLMPQLNDVEKEQVTEATFPTWYILFRIQYISTLIQLIIYPDNLPSNLVCPSRRAWPFFTSLARGKDSWKHL